MGSDEARNIKYPEWVRLLNFTKDTHKRQNQSWSAWAGDVALDEVGKVSVSTASPGAAV